MRAFSIRVQPEEQSQYLGFVIGVRRSSVVAAGEVDAKELLLPLLLGWSCSRLPGLGVRKESWVWKGGEWRQERFLPSPPPPNDRNPPGQTRAHLCPPSSPPSQMQMTYRGGWCLSHRGAHTPGPALRGTEKRDPIGGEGVECWTTTPRQRGGLATQRRRVWAAHHLLLVANLESAENGSSFSSIFQIVHASLVANHSPEPHRKGATGKHLSSLAMLPPHRASLKRQEDPMFRISFVTTDP